MSKSGLGLHRLSKHLVYSTAIPATGTQNQRISWTS